MGLGEAKNATCMSLLKYNTKAYVPTYSKPPPYPHTLGAAQCSHNIVVDSASSESLREGDGGHLNLGVRGVPVV